MKDNCILTAESVTEGHPDKLCDTIADAVVDACLTQDAAARVACEVMATAGKIIAAGEITAAKIPDIPAIICRTVREAGYGSSDYEVEVITHEQSPDIAEAVCGGTETGAGDQGILYGFACDETKELLPLPVVLAHRLTRLLTDTRRQGIILGLRPDGKAQVSVEYRSGVPYRVAAVVVSCQHEEELPLPELRRDILRHVIRPAMQELPLDELTEVLVNPSGRFVQGGFEADTGLTGRKLMVDTYGGLVPHGGGALSGKDGTKVDRSGAYMARYIAKNIVAAGLAKRCTISLAYAIGKAQPVAVTVDTEHTGIYSDDVLEQAVCTVFNLTPDGMIGTLGLDQPMFQKFCNYGHFTHADAPWERTVFCVGLEGSWRANDIGVSHRYQKRPARDGLSRACYHCTESLNALPGLKAGALEAGISMVAPVAGFLPVRAARSFTSKVPKPSSCTLAPDFNAVCSVSTNAFRAVAQSFLVRPLASAIAVISSVLFIVFRLLHI